MENVLPMVIGALVLASAGIAVFLTFRDSKKPQDVDQYLHALEHWIEGDLERAATLLHQVVHDDPGAVEPFLQLGNLLRLQGDPERAAVLHRGLTVRSNLSLAQKLSIGLSLAEDLNALGQWEGARDVLDSLPRTAQARTRYWKTRFHQWHGLGDRPEAARTLKNASRQGSEKDRPWFLAAYVGPVVSLLRSPFPRRTNSVLAIAYVITAIGVAWVGSQATLVEMSAAASDTGVVVRVLVEMVQPFWW